MSRIIPTSPSDRIIETMIELARCSKSHRIILVGPSGSNQELELHRRGYHRIATTATCGLPRGQYDVAFVEWQLPSIKALEATLDWLVHFLAPAGVLVIWVAPGTDRRRLGSILEGLGFHVEAGTRCERGLVVSARRLDAIQHAIAA
jgi:hypothetical protein